MFRMPAKMTTVAILCLLLLERFLASDMDDITQPVLNGLRTLEKTVMKYAGAGKMKSNRKFTSFFLFTPELRMESVKLDLSDPLSFRYFNPSLETKIIIHGFLDKAIIAKWMHRMKDEFLMLDDYNVIIVDWSVGNFLPYSQAAANTDQTGEEISHLLAILKDVYGANPSKFHLIGHSLGSHVAGYVGERFKGLKRITALDPATHLFKEASPRARLDPSDAMFVDAIHTDAGGIGMEDPVGHVDFYPNGGATQPGCTASNSLKSLLEKGIVEGVRNMICSHMRAVNLFTDTINARGCQMVGYKCLSWESFSRGECDSCGYSGEDCAVMGYHMDVNRNYGNRTKYYMLTSNIPHFCGYEYKITLYRNRSDEARYVNSTERSQKEWGSMDVLHISLYGSSGNAEFRIEGKKNGWQDSHIVYSHSFLGDVLGSITRWSKKPLSRAKGVMDVVAKVIKRDGERPFIRRMKVFPLKTYTQWRIAPIIFELCVSPILDRTENQQGATFRSEHC